MKKLLATLLVLSALALLLVSCKEEKTSANPEFSKGLSYVQNEDETYTVSGIGSCTDTNVIISSTHNGKKVTGIGESAFTHATFTEITLPKSITSIGEYAFSNCASLTSIVIPDSVTTVGGCAFAGCTNLKNIYYTDTEEKWMTIAIDSFNSPLIYATRYYYSETQPTTLGNYWRYVDGVPTAW